MISRCDCALEGVSLTSLDSRICITDVAEMAPTERIHTMQHPLYSTRVLRKAREKLTVQVHFLIREEDAALRQQVLRAVRDWAAPGGVLTATDRPGLQLSVLCEGLPGLSSLNWQETLTLTFSAFSCPYWESAIPSSAVTDAAASLLLPGSGPDAPVSVRLINTGDAPITQVNITAGNTAMTFRNIALPAAGMFVLAYKDGLLFARVGGVSILDRRTAESDDLLLAPCGETSAVSVSADGTVSATFTARGRFA